MIYFPPAVGGESNHDKRMNIQIVQKIIRKPDFRNFYKMNLSHFEGV
ncbi:MAG: hypothetical protein LBR79_04435 [Oscillospiraceae bacterium]|nr:hypothetical protein [Oscillospiraceae bacterium]